MIGKLLLPLLLIVATLGCSTGSPSPSLPTSPPAGGQITATSDPAAHPVNLGQSTGVVPEFTSGMDQLESYQARLEMSFSGKYDGNPVDIRTTVTQTLHKPLAFQMLVFEDTATGEQDLWEMSAYLQDAAYYQYGRDGTCLVMPAENISNLEDLPHPSGWLPVPQGAQTGKTETINGFPAQHYIFSEQNLDEAGGFQASGEYWLAAPGGWLVKYALTLTGGEDAFGDGTSGSQTFTYLVDLEAAKSASLPAACPSRLADFPTLPGASQLVRLPNSLAYETGQTAAQARQFYEESMPAAGWVMGTDPIERADGTTLYYLNEQDERAAIVRIWQPEGLTQVVIEETSLAEQEASAGSSQAGGPANPNQRVSEALSLLSGDDQNASVFSSYHLEMDNTTPGYNQSSESVIVKREIMKADVQGKKVHLFFGSGPDDLIEGYIDGDSAYEVVGGKLQEDWFKVSMTWAMWQMDIVFPYGYATTSTSFIGYDELDKRQVEVYAIDSRQAPPGVLEALQSFMLIPITQSYGTVWVDSQTGGLLKLVLDYEADFKHPDSGAAVGNGVGRIELSVSQIGQVEVSVEP
jgi:hypothetical protein